MYQYNNDFIHIACIFYFIFSENNVELLLLSTYSSLRLVHGIYGAIRGEHWCVFRAEDHHLSGCCGTQENASYVWFPAGY